MENKLVFGREDLKEGRDFWVPVRLIRKLRDRKDFESNQNALVRARIENANDGYSTIMVKVEGYTNLDSKYGSFYIKGKDLLKYLNDPDSYIHRDPQREKYLYEVLYLNRGGLTKYIASNKEYNQGDTVLLNSYSSSVTTARIEHRWDKDSIYYNRYYDLKFDRYIVASFNEVKSIVEDNAKNRLQEKIDTLTDRCNKLEALVLKLTLQSNGIE